MTHVGCTWEGVGRRRHATRDHGRLSLLSSSALLRRRLHRSSSYIYLGSIILIPNPPRQETLSLVDDDGALPFLRYRSDPF